MTLPAQLRAIADRLEAAEAEKAAALDELWQIRTVDSTAVQEAAEEHQPGAEQSSPSASAPAAPIEQATSEERAGGRMNVTVDSPATIPASPAFDPLGPELRACLEPGCGRSFTSPHGLQVHRTRAHGRNWSTKPELTEPEKPSKRATAGARLAARDAARANPRPARSPAPAAGVTRPASIGAAPVIRKGTESWVCNRCPESFRTREARDLHQEADHANEPRRLPVGEPQPVFDTSGGGLP